jgi:uncharacterized protein
MKLLALPDLHQDTRSLPLLADQLAEVDLVLLVGDLVNATGAQGVADVLQALRLHNPNLLAIPGNWDDPAACAYLTGEGINVHRQHVLINQIAFAGAGGSLPSIGRTPNEVTETELAAILADSIRGLDLTIPLVLLCHHPPQGTRTDWTWGQQHAGSQAVRAFIERIQPIVCITGHIHEAIGVDRIGRTQIINPGPLWKGGYAYIELTSDAVIVECRRLVGVAID